MRKLDLRFEEEVWNSKKQFIFSSCKDDFIKLTDKLYKLIYMLLKLMDMFT
jgi:hypothetical protein